MTNTSISNIIEKKLIYHHFQTIIDLSNYEVFGYEGLLRTFSYLNPQILFEEANKNGKLFSLDTISIQKAVTTYSKEFKKTVKEDECLFLNIYPTTIMTPLFLTFIEKLQAFSQISSNRIVFEINELENVDNVQNLREIVLHLKKIGFQIALDDIGKSVMTFERLFELEPDYIKLDQYFSYNLLNSPKKQRMIKLLLDYCSGENINIILEGVEKEENFKVAKSLGIPFAQGYFFGKPDSLFKISNKDR